MRSARRARVTWFAIEEVGGSVECLSTETSWDRGVEQEGPDTLIQGAQSALSTPILLAGVST